MTTVQPGDWFVVDPGSELFDRIELGERLTEWLTHGPDAKGARWGHAGVATRWQGQHTPGCPSLRPSHRPCDCGSPGPVLMIVEAEPGGAREVPWHWQDRPHMWSSGTGLSVPPMGEWAGGLIGTPYSFADYGAIAAHALHLWAPGLRRYIQTSKHLICSQLVDRCAELAGVHLFDDGRWNGYVTPLDLALLLSAKGVRL